MRGTGLVFFVGEMPQKFNIDFNDDIMRHALLTGSVAEGGKQPVNRRRRPTTKWGGAMLGGRLGLAKNRLKQIDRSRNTNKTLALCCVS